MGRMIDHSKHRHRGRATESVASADVPFGYDTGYKPRIRQPKADIRSETERLVAEFEARKAGQRRDIAGTT